MLGCVMALSQGRDRGHGETARSCVAGGEGRGVGDEVREAKGGQVIPADMKPLPLWDHPLTRGCSGSTWLLFSQWVSAGDLWQCLETFLIFTKWGEDASGIQ